MVTTLEARQQSGEVQYYRCPIDPGRGSSAAVHLGYRRATDFDEGDRRGQDFAAARWDERHVVGVVADGVAQSFYGDLAAEHVGTELLAWLWQHRDEPPSGEALEPVLRRWSEVLHEVIRTRPLPPGVPIIVQQALEGARAAGSQAVIAAFVLDVERRAARVYLVGDAVALVHARGPDGRAAVDVLPSDPGGRWSSGGQTAVRLSVHDRVGPSVIVVKSDGANRWGQDTAPDDASEDVFRAVAEQWARVDDVSFVAAVLEPVRGPSTPALDEATGAAATAVPPSRSTPDASPAPAPAAPPRTPEPSAVETWDDATGKGRHVDLWATRADGSPTPDSSAPSPRKRASSSLSRRRVGAGFVLGLLLGVGLGVAGGRAISRASPRVPAVAATARGPAPAPGRSADAGAPRADAERRASSAARPAPSGPAASGVGAGYTRAGADTAIPTGPHVGAVATPRPVPATTAPDTAARRRDLAGGGQDRVPDAHRARPRSASAAADGRHDLPSREARPARLAPPVEHTPDRRVHSGPAGGRADAAAGAESRRRVRPGRAKPGRVQP